MAAKYTPVTTAWRLQSRYHRVSAASYRRDSNASLANEATVRTLAMASLATPLAAANASCEALAFADIHSPYTRFARAVNGITAHARAPRRRFCTQRYAAMPPTRTVASATLRNTQLRSEATAVQSLESRDATAPTETTSKYPTSWAKIFENSVERSRRITRFCTKVNRNTFQKSSAALTDPAATKSSSARRSFPGSRSMHAPTQRDTKCGAASENGRRTTRESNPRPNHW